VKPNRATLGEGHTAPFEAERDPTRRSGAAPGEFFRFSAGQFQASGSWPFFIARYMGYKQYEPGFMTGVAIGGTPDNRIDPKFRSVCRCPSWGQSVEESSFLFNDPLVSVMSNQRLQGGNFILSGGYGMSPHIPPKAFSRSDGTIAITHTGEQLSWMTEYWKYMQNASGNLNKIRKSALTVLVADGSGNNAHLGDQFEIRTKSPFALASGTAGQEPEQAAHFGTDYIRHNGGRRDAIRWIRDTPSQIYMRGTRGGLNVLYADGHVGYTESARALNLLKEFHAEWPKVHGNQFLNQLQ
jgi:prepilin-type processing-associated H-X9-DG protein